VGGAQREEHAACEVLSWELAAGLEKAAEGGRSSLGNPNS
jgi:hypothetical protein